MSIHLKKRWANDVQGVQNIYDMNAMLLLQARTNSSRLPGKVLLPIAGIPLVVLSALRAGNTGHPVMVVTSSEASDDILSGVLSSWGIDYFRGDLEDTLKRYVDALKDVPDCQVVVRLTGDNVFPDGSFIDGIVEDFEKRKVAYLGCVGQLSGLPYGVSAEVTRAGFIREAHRETESSFDREHVTPWVIAKYGCNYFEKYRSLQMSHYRCTVDILDDYLLVAGLFAGIKKPENYPMIELIGRLKRASKAIVTHKPATRIALGTAQFGLNYGIANKLGCPEQEIVNILVRTAIKNGVQHLDTARAYGNSEEVLGKTLAEGWSSRVTVITKLSPMDDCPPEASPAIVEAFVERSVYNSCRLLGVTRLDVLLLHRASHLTAWHGAVWDAVSHLRRRGVIAELGVSVQTPDEALTALEFDEVSVVQMPYNILDNRWQKVISMISEVRKQRSLVVHARSVLLQGLLSTEKPELWKRAGFQNPDRILKWLRDKANHFSSGDIIELCLRFALSHKWIDCIVLGLETKEQLLNNLRIVELDPWTHDQLTRIVEDRPLVPGETLDPSTWINADA